MLRDRITARLLTALSTQPIIYEVNKGCWRRLHVLFRDLRGNITAIGFVGTVSDVFSSACPGTSVIVGFILISFCQGGYAFCAVYLSVLTDCHETWWQGAAWAMEDPITFWSGSESQGEFNERCKIQHLALVEVCAHRLKI